MRGAKFYNNLSYDNRINFAFDSGGNDCEIYFNTFVNGKDQDTSSYGCIQIKGLENSGNVFKNNLFIQDAAVHDHPIMYASAGTLLSDVANTNTFDYNIYYHTTSSAANIFYDEGPHNYTFAQWQALTGSPDANSTLLIALPGFVVRYTDFHPADAGNLDGHDGIAIAGYGVDIDRNTRAARPTAGAMKRQRHE